MKKLVPIFVLLIIPMLCYGLDATGYDTVTLSKSKEPPQPFCPVSKISDNNKCFQCHVLKPDKNGNPIFGIKELELNAGYDAMPKSGTIVTRGGKLQIYTLITSTNSEVFRGLANYIYRHPEFKKLIVELQTPGGSVMDAWRAVGIIQEMQENGIMVETRVNGIAASAGVLLMAAGNRGCRYVNRHAEIMMHKVWTFTMMDLKTPDTAEDQAETLKHFQDNINRWLISRSNLTAEKIENYIYKKDFWLTGERAVNEFGLADNFIGEARSKK